MTVALAGPLGLAIRRCAAIALPLTILFGACGDERTDQETATRDLSPVRASTTDALPGRIYATASRNLPEEGTRYDVISLDPNTGHWRIVGVPFTPVEHLRLSPSGTTAAYGRFARLGEPRRDAVFACPLDRPSEEIRLLPDAAYELTWAPDGERVIVTTCDYKPVNGQLVLRMEAWLVNVDGTHQSRMPIPDTHAVLDWSADGRYLLTFVPLRTQPREARPGFVTSLYIVQPDGTDVRRVSPEGLHCIYGRFSPDSVHIAYRTSVTPPLGTPPRRSHFKYRVSIAKYTGADCREIVREDAAGIPYHMCWSPDGRFIAVRIGGWTERGGVLGDILGGVTFLDDYWIDIYDISGRRIRTLKSNGLSLSQNALDWR